MKYLFNSRGQRIANEVNGQLHLPSGKNIGHFLSNEGIFIDMHGRYLGEIVQGDRLMQSRNSPYKSTSFGNYGNFGDAGNYGDPGHHGSIGVVPGYEDVALERLRQSWGIGGNLHDSVRYNEDDCRATWMIKQWVSSRMMCP